MGFGVEKLEVRSEILESEPGFVLVISHFQLLASNFSLLTSNF
jgi:hypothetical protein